MSPATAAAVWQRAARPAQTTNRKQRNPRRFNCKTQKRARPPPRGSPPCMFGPRPRLIVLRVRSVLRVLIV
eukprot:2612509-Lingulodinium_polyedra.AAC.1